MVVRLIKLFIFYGIFFHMSPATAYSQDDTQSSYLTVNISKTDKQLGQYFRVTLKYKGHLKLENIDLNSWQENFKILHGDEYKNEDKQGNIIQVLMLRLYPRMLNITLLPSLSLGKTRSTKISLKVMPSKIKNSTIKLNWEISNQNPWEREAVLIRIHIKSNDPTARVIIDASETPGLLLQPLKTEHKVLKNGEIEFNSGWIFYSLNNGSVSLNLPAIRYQLSGSDRRRFYLPIQKLSVKPLPNYLPPNLPIGKLNINSEIKNNNTASWKTNITTPALALYDFPEINQQLSAFSGYDIATIENEIRQLSSYSNYGYLHTVTSPLPKWLMPFGSSIDLKVRYFDPETGTLEETLHTLPRYWNMPQWAWWVTFIISVFISAILIKLFKPCALNQISRFKLHQQIKKSNSPDQIRSLILNESYYMTLSQWSNDNHERQLFADKLNKICFSVVNYSDLSKLRVEALQLI
ncbi:MAG: hypothetical protein QM500_15880 [Methylococcales bacterium]